MVYILTFVGGAVIGAVLASWVMAKKSATGYFRVNPLDGEDGFYTVKMSVTPDQNLLTKNLIILKRDSSHE